MKQIRQKENIFGAPPLAQGHLCNIGCYGIPNQLKFQKPYSFIRDNKKLEELLMHNYGRKVYE